MSDVKLESANINMWKETLDTSISSFFGVMSDIIHIAILVRFLPQEQMGVFFISYAFLYLFAQIPRGFGIAIRKRTSEMNSGRSKYLWCGFILIIPVLFLLFLILLISQPVFNSYSSVKLSKTVLLSLFFATTGFSTLEFSRYYMAGCGNPGKAEKLRTSIAKTTMPIITIIFLLYNPTVESALFAVFISYFSTSIIIFKLSPHKYNLPSLEVIIDILKYSKWSVTTSILNDFYHRWDSILLGIMVGSIAVGYYDSSLRIAFLATTFAVGVSKTSNVKMSGMLEYDKNIEDISGKTLIASTFLIFPLLLLCIFNSRFILGVIYSAEYTSAEWYLILIIIAQIFQAYRMQFESIFNSSDKPRATTKTSFICVIINIITAPFLVIYFGGLGVIYSTILSEFVRFAIYEVQLNKLFGTYIIPNGLLIQYLSFGIISIILYIIQLIKFSDITFFIISFMFSTIGFYMVQYFLSDETKDIIDEYLSNK